MFSFSIENAKSHDTPPATLTFQISESERATAIAKRLRNKSGRIKVEEVTFAMKAGKQKLRESYLLTAGFLSDGTPMDHEQIRDLLDLQCTSQRIAQVDPAGFEANLNQQMEALGKDVQERNASFFLQQEALIDAARLDLKATFDAKIREYQAKENTAMKAARKAASAAEELKYKQEARQWRRKAEDADDQYRAERNRLRDESDVYLDSARESLNATETRTGLFTINWVIK